MQASINEQIYLLNNYYTAQPLLVQASFLLS